MNDLELGTLPTRPATVAHDASPESDSAGGDASPTMHDAPDASGRNDDCQPVTCRGQPAACGNCLDDDADGLIDQDDPDCFSPCHDNEFSFNKRMSCPDESCYFDSDCGAGNDARCLGLTPNGCDCHGCCYSLVAERYVQLGSSLLGSTECSSQSLLDPNACRECAPDFDCFNPCDDCELCFGETTLPGHCIEVLRCDDSPPHCPPDGTSCLPGVCPQACQAGTICRFGCCLPDD